MAETWCDIERIASKIALRVVRPKELASLRSTLRAVPKMVAWSDSLPPHLRGFFAHAIPSEAICKLLEKYLEEEPSTWLRDGDVIADGVDTELDECRLMQKGHSKFLREYEEQEKLATNIPNLKVEYNGIQGFFISVTKSHLDKVPTRYTRKQTLKNAERFITADLKAYEEKALSAKARSLAREKVLFSSLLNKLQPYVGTLQKQARIIAEWDVLNALASLADKYEYSRPEFSKHSEFTMIQGRHPVLDIVQSNFVPNSISLSHKANLAIITGPNMGGKSTVMRQLALLSILAYIGSFVPAKRFVVPDLDAIYTRIGANDDIAQGRSTFMVEMHESAFILNNATKNSLVLIDELGRGTATFDGLSIAWSIAEYLGNTTGSFVLFATHYQELTELPKKFKNMANLHVSAVEQGSEIIFTHVVEPGSANRSYGIHVAELAGLPLEIIVRAKTKLADFEKAKHKKSTLDNNIVKENGILSLDLNNMSPLQALEWLINKQQELKKKG